MKKRRLLAMAAILFCVIGLFSFSGCTARYKLSIKNEPNIAVLSRLKTRYAAGEQVTIVTEVVLDADVEVFLNGQSIGKQTAVYTENGYQWEYYFDMPARNAVLKFEIVSGSGLLPAPVEIKNIRYVRTGWAENTNKSYQIIKSVSELTDYFKNNKTIFQLENAVAYHNAVKNYDNDFFETYFIVLVVLEEGSGGNSHKVRSCFSDQRELTLNIERIFPKPGTDGDCAMQGWHIFLELSKDYGDIDRVKIEIIN